MVGQWRIYNFCKLFLDLIMSLGLHWIDEEETKDPFSGTEMGFTDVNIPHLVCSFSALLHRRSKSTGPQRQPARKKTRVVSTCLCVTGDPLFLTYTSTSTLCYFYVLEVIWFVCLECGLTRMALLLLQINRLKINKADMKSSC